MDSKVPIFSIESRRVSDLVLPQYAQEIPDVQKPVHDARAIRTFETETEVTPHSQVEKQLNGFSATLFGSHLLLIGCLIGLVRLCPLASIRRCVSS